MLAVLIEVDGSVTGVDLDHGKILEDAREHIRGWPTVVKVRRKGKIVDMLCDEEGAPKGLPVNPLASVIAHQPIVGSVIILHHTLGEIERGQLMGGNTDAAPTEKKN